MRCASLLAVVLCLPALAAKPRPAATRPEPAPPPPTVNTALATPALLEHLGALYEGLEFDSVIPVAEALLARADLTLDQRLETYRLYGSAKGVVQDPIDAEQPFRMLLRARPDYEMPQGTPPKILAVFSKVQLEERALATQLAEVERARIVASLKLIGEPPSAANGGKPLRFSFQLRDPSGSVEAVRVPYRRSGQPQFSALALSRTEGGDWKGTIPGELTSNETGFQLEYYVETLDSKGPLLQVGSAGQPRTIAVSAGQLSLSRPPPVPRGLFFSAVALTVLLAATSVGTGVAFNSTQAEYNRMGFGSTEVDGAQLTAVRQRGERLGGATTGLVISTGVVAIVTAVLAPFTNWRGEEAP